MKPILSVFASPGLVGMWQSLSFQISHTDRSYMAEIASPGMEKRILLAKTGILVGMRQRFLEPELFDDIFFADEGTFNTVVFG